MKMLKINLSLTTFASDFEFHYGIENFQIFTMHIFLPPSSKSKKLSRILLYLEATKNIAKFVVHTVQ